MTKKLMATKTERLVMTALMISLVFVGTVAIRIPIPFTQGYVHAGDALIYLAVLLLGKKHAAAAAGIGSAMADILGGFAAWAPWTLVIKAAMAFVAGYFIGSHADAEHIKSKKALFIRILGMTLGGIVMTAGYFAAEGIMYGNWMTAALGIPWNIGQFAAGILIATIIHRIVISLAA